MEAIYKASWATKLREWWLQNPERNSKIAKEIITHQAQNSIYMGLIWDWIYQRYRWGYTYPQIYDMWPNVDAATINTYIRTFSRKLLQELISRGEIAP